MLQKHVVNGDATNYISMLDAVVFDWLVCESEKMFSQFFIRGGGNCSITKSVFGRLVIVFHGRTPNVEVRDAAKAASQRSEAELVLTAGLGLRLCENCKHLDDSEEGWKVCARPNYPEGYKWNLMCTIQRYHDASNEELCNGKYWEPNVELTSRTPQADGLG
jgi:hypothetical protein